MQRSCACPPAGTLSDTSAPGRFAGRSRHCRHAGRRHSSRRCVMVAIAMTREMGTLGKDVAQSIADSLGLKVIHSELVEHDLATRLGVKESAVHRYLEGGASVLERWKIDKEKLSRYTAEELLEFARAGNVIIRG